MAQLQLPGDEMVQGAGGIAEGLPAAFAGTTIPKFRDSGLLIVHAGGESRQDVESITDARAAREVPVGQLSAGMGRVGPGRTAVRTGRAG